MAARQALIALYGSYTDFEAANEFGIGQAVEIA